MKNEYKRRMPVRDEDYDYEAHFANGLYTELPEPPETKIRYDMGAIRAHMKKTGTYSIDWSNEEFYRIAKPTRGGKPMTWEEYLKVFSK